MQNIEVKREGTVLLLRIDLAQEHGRTGGGAGKNITVASTKGNRELAAIGATDFYLSVNVYKREGAKVNE